MKFKKRYVVLAILAVWLVYQLGFSDYETIWQPTGKIAVEAPKSHSYLLLSDINRWEQWLTWSWHPKPNIVQTTDELGPVALVQQEDGDVIAKIRIGRSLPNQQVNFNITVGTDREAMAGGCMIKLLDGKNQHFLQWQCTGRYSEDYSKVMLRLGIYPNPPFEIAQSLDRLRHIVETGQITDKPENL